MLFLENFLRFYIKTRTFIQRKHTNSQRDLRRKSMCYCEISLSLAT